MPSPASPTAGPDGFGPIDAVVTWVDGDDPAFRARRREAAERLTREDPELAARSDIRFAPVRYVQHDEVRYCVRSILNHAPWVRCVWLVTDDQFPAVFDRDRLDERVTVVSHRALFRELPEALPTFNSGAIEVMLSRIEGLSDRFICFNDDFFLTKPTTPADFFRGDKPVLRGKWMESGAGAPAWLQRRIRSAELFGFDATRFLREVHAPYSLSRPAIEALFAAHPGLRERMARRRFRSADDYYVVALHNHYCMANDLSVMDETNRWLVFGGYPKGEDAATVRESLERIASGKFFSTCINALGEFVETVPEVLDFLDAGTGPRLAFERADPSR